MSMEQLNEEQSRVLAAQFIDRLSHEFASRFSQESLTHSPYAAALKDRSFCNSSYAI
jgi:hypothetical protein